MDYLVPEMQSYHLDMGSLSGAGEMDPAMHFRDLYGGRGQAGSLCSILFMHFRDISLLPYALQRRKFIMHVRDKTLFLT